MADFFDRLDTYMKYRGLNDNKLTVLAQLSIGALGKQRKGGRGLSVESIAKILYACPDLDADWLMTGRGEMLKPESPKPEGNLGQVSDPDSSKIIGELTEVIRTQAKALLEQQQFINAHFSRNGMDSVTPPLQKEVNLLTNKNISLLFEGNMPLWIFEA